MLERLTDLLYPHPVTRNSPDFVGYQRHGRKIGMSVSAYTILIYCCYLTGIPLQVEIEEASSSTVQSSDNGRITALQPTTTVPPPSTSKQMDTVTSKSPAPSLHKNEAPSIAKEVIVPDSQENKSDSKYRDLLDKFEIAASESRINKAINHNRLSADSNQSCPGVSNKSGVKAELKGEARREAYVSPSASELLNSTHRSVESLSSTKSDQNEQQDFSLWEDTSEISFSALNNAPNKPRTDELNQFPQSTHFNATGKTMTVIKAKRRQPSSNTPNSYSKKSRMRLASVETPRFTGGTSSFGKTLRQTSTSTPVDKMVKKPTNSTDAPGVIWSPLNDSSIFQEDQATRRTNTPATLDSSRVIPDKDTASPESKGKLSGGEDNLPQSNDLFSGKN